MAEKIKIDLEVIDNVETSISNLKMLKRQLRELAAGTEEYDKVKQKIYDMDDALKSANVGASNFAEIVGGLPGPVGELGDKVGSSVNVLKQFGNIKLDALKNSFSELGKDIGDGVKGLAKLTGITKVYEASVAGLTTLMRALGVSETAAAAAAEGLSGALIATGIGALIVGIGLLIANWDKLIDKISGVTEVTKAYKQANEDGAKAVGDFNAKLWEVKTTLEAAKKGTISKKDALKEYNDKLGDTVGYAGSLAQAEQLMADNTTKVVQAIGLRAQAQSLYAEAAKKTAEATTAEKVGFWDIGGKGLFQSYSDELAQRKNKLVSQSADLKKKADELLTQAIGIESTKTKGLATKPEEKKGPTGETAEQRKARLKKEAEAIQEELNKVAEAAYAKSLKDRDRELYEAGGRYNELLAKAKKYGLDTTALTEAYRQEETNINKKYDDIDTKTKQERLDKEKEFWKNAKKAADEKREKEREDKLKEDAKIKGDDDARYARLMSGAANDLDLQRQLLEAKKVADEEYYKKQLANEKLTADEIRQLNADKLADQIFYTEKSNEIEKSRIAVKQKALDDIISIVGQESDIGKAALVAKQILNAKELVMEITKTITFSTQAAARSIVAVAEGTAQTAKVGFPQNIPLLIGYAAQAVGIISAIMSAVSSAKSVGANGSISTSASIPQPSYAGGIPSITAPQINTPTTSTPGAQLAETLAMSSKQPIKAYVVSSDISSQQALDRKTNKGATFAMG